jgi:hypothetical protein
MATSFQLRMLAVLGVTVGMATSPCGSVSALENAHAVDADGGSYSESITEVTKGTVAFHIGDAISLQAQSGSVTNSGFANELIAARVIRSVPEPPASILIGGGLLLISLLVRRVTSRQ